MWVLTPKTDGSFSIFSTKERRCLLKVAFFQYKSKSDVTNTGPSTANRDFTSNPASSNSFLRSLGL